MNGSRAAAFLLVALGVAACDTEEPTGLNPSDTESTVLMVERSAKAGSAMNRGALLTGIPVEVPGLENARLSITEITRNEEGGFLVDGLLRGTQDGVAVTEVITDAPADLSRAAPAGSSSGDFGTLQQRGRNESGVCDILFLDLGPIFLDLLGLTVDLSPIELDVDAEPGPGNLLGNLLCAVVGLLDGGPLAAIDNLLDRVNTVLDNLTGLLEGIGVTSENLIDPETGDVVDGVFEGTVTLTGLALDEAGNIVATGNLSGTALGPDGVLQEVDQAFTDVVVSLSETLDASGAMVSMQQSSRGANEEGVCDILFLDLGPIFLDLLGLTVDLSPIELDLDAQRGQGNLLGNLLCGVLGLLDPLNLAGLTDLLDRINNLLG